jgi:hypothetical protein
MAAKGAKKGSKGAKKVSKAAKTPAKASPAARKVTAAPTKAVAPARGLKPGDRFGQQAHTLAKVFRTYGLVAEAGGDKFTPDEIEQLAVDQTADEDQDAALEKAWTDFHAPYSVRANQRALRLSAALKAARGLLAGNAAALAELKGAQFNKGPAKPPKPGPGT